MMMEKLSFSSNHQPLLISIEGNIGAGKSSLIEKLKSKHSDWYFIDEPVGVWSTLKNDNDESLLQVYYKDSKRWSYTFQSCALLSRFQNINNAVLASSSSEQGIVVPGQVNKQQVFVTERCLDTDYHVFSKMLRDGGCMDKLEFEIYYRLYQHLQSTTTLPLSAIINVDTNPLECLKRIKNRNREGESEISAEYLSQLDKYQKDWIDNLNEIPVMKTDGSASSSSISEIESFVNRQLVNSEERKSYNVCL
jgi:deoxyadenosine/deoxycytidine kinase